MSEYRETGPRRLVCNEEVGGCGEVFEASVKIHKKTGVAGVTCPECGKTQEPIDAEVQK